MSMRELLTTQDACVSSYPENQRETLPNQFRSVHAFGHNPRSIETHCVL